MPGTLTAPKTLPGSLTQSTWSWPWHIPLTATNPVSTLPTHMLPFLPSFPRLTSEAVRRSHLSHMHKKLAHCYEGSIGTPTTNFEPVFTISIQSLRGTASRALSSMLPSLQYRMIIELAASLFCITSSHSLIEVFQFYQSICLVGYYESTPWTGASKKTHRSLASEMTEIHAGQVKSQVLGCIHGRERKSIK